MSSVFGCQHRMQTLRKQRGGTDCSLFAITVITAIAYGKDQSHLQFNQEEKRDHLLHCFQNEYIILFPFFE